jgi:hypothetical protein
MKIELNVLEAEQLLNLVRGRLHHMQTLIREGIIFESHFTDGIKLYDNIAEQYTKQLPVVK